MGEPRFTFCIPNLNKQGYLPACIESVLSQDCRDWRCVFVDGYSTDGSWEYMQQFASDSRFLLLRGRNQGMYRDWNECLQYVDTEYFYFLTSDDTCYPTLVSSTTAALDLHPNVDACHFQFCLIDERGELISAPECIIQEKFGIYSEVNHYAHLRSGICEFFMHLAYCTNIYMTITSLVFRRNLLFKMKEFSCHYGTLGDFDWAMQLGLFTDVLYLPKLLATWRIYEGQATQNLNSLENRKKMLKIGEKNLNYYVNSYNSRDISIYKTKRSLCYLSDLYASALVDSMNFRPNFLLKNIRLVYFLLFNFPNYVFKKIIKVASWNKLFSFDQSQFARSLIKENNLCWPPRSVDFTCKT
jgi:glycosyltransferase involved in cell wall biosynthesis